MQLPPRLASYGARNANGRGSGLGVIEQSPVHRAGV